MTMTESDLATQVAAALEAINRLNPRKPGDKELLRRIEAALTTDGTRLKSLLRTDAAFKLTRANAPDWLKNSLRDIEANLTAHVTAVGELEARLTAVENRVADHSVTLGLHGDDIAKLKAQLGQGWKSQLWIAGALGGMGLAVLWLWGVRFHGSQANRWGWVALAGVFGLFFGLAVSFILNQPAKPTVVVIDDDEDDDDADPGNTAAATPPATVAVGTGAAAPVAVPTGTAPAALPATAVVPTTTVVTPSTVTTTP